MSQLTIRQFRLAPAIYLLVGGVDGDAGELEAEHVLGVDELEDGLGHDDGPLQRGDSYVIGSSKRCFLGCVNYQRARPPAPRSC